MSKQRILLEDIIKYNSLRQERDSIWEDLSNLRSGDNPILFLSKGNSTIKIHFDNFEENTVKNLLECMRDVLHKRLADVDTELEDILFRGNQND